MTDRPDTLMIFAAGFGTRMGDLTANCPKPMLPLAGRPMIDRAVDVARQAGFARIFANTHFLHDRIAPHLRNLGVTVLHETPDILDTGGALKAAMKVIGSETVATLNPDAVFTGSNPLQQLLDGWTDQMQGLLLLASPDIAVCHKGEGDFSLEDGEIRRKGTMIYTGAQILRLDHLVEIPERIFSLNRYWDHLLAKGPVNGQPHNGKWCDVGHPDGLKQAERLLAETDV